jgi:hypothetical protein
MSINLDNLATTVEKYMPDTIVVKRRTGVVMNPVDMEEDPVYTEIYNGKAFVTPMGDPAGTLRASEDVYRVQYEIGIPRSAAEIKPNDEILVTASADPLFVASDVPILVHDIIHATFFTHRRIKGFRDRSAV